jgi:hypothetical protein
LDRPRKKKTKEDLEFQPGVRREIYEMRFIMTSLTGFRGNTMAKRQVRMGVL